MTDIDAVPVTQPHHPATTVWTCNAAWYEGRKDGHPELWLAVEAFIRERDIKSMVEIGGGHGYASELVDEYLGIERNPVAVIDGRKLYPAMRFIHAPLTEEKVADITGQYQLFLACAVAEHCESFETLLQFALKLTPRHILISFFRGLDREENEINRVESEQTVWSEAGGVYWNNFYSGNRLRKWLDLRDLDYSITQHGVDAILHIESLQDLPSRSEQ